MSVGRLSSQRVGLFTAAHLSLVTCRLSTRCSDHFAQMKTDSTAHVIDAIPHAASSSSSSSALLSSSLLLLFSLSSPLPVRCLHRPPLLPPGVCNLPSRMRHSVSARTSVTAVSGRGERLCSRRSVSVSSAHHEAGDAHSPCSRAGGATGGRRGEQRNTTHHITSPHLTSPHLTSSYLTSSHLPSVDHFASPPSVRIGRAPRKDRRLRCCRCRHCS